MKKLLTTSAIIGAITFSTLSDAEAVMKKRVTFESHNQTIVGDLYLPDDYQDGDKLPGVIVTGSWTSVKEQMAGGYAEELADRGFAALAFDHRGWGESNEGTPISLQFVEDPQAKTQDILAAADFMTTRSEVDSTKLATLGVCASAGYAIDAANISDKITTTASIAPWLHDKEIVDEVYGENVPALLKATADAKESGQPVILEAAGDADSDAVMKSADYYTDPNRGAIEAYDNKFSTLSWGPWLTYDAIQTASKIDKPVLLVHSEAAAIPQGAKTFAEKGGENVELIMMENVTQFDFYDQPEAMDKAADKVADHFKKTLN
jgi:fermentation-respiration switch protein FrsA (DUF1100 family)